MLRTPLIRRLVAIAVAALIPFGAAASSARAATFTPQSSPLVTVTDDDSGVLFTPFAPNRSSWS